MICLRCGACCRFYIVECDWFDAVREPRLIAEQGLTPKARELGLRYDGPLTLADLESGERCIMLAGIEPCRFQGADNRCTIYPTRPNSCVGFLPGSDQCREARKACGYEDHNSIEGAG